MRHAFATADFHPVARLMPYFVGGLIAVVAVDYLPPAVRQIATWPTFASTPARTVSNAAAKTDRLTPKRAMTSAPDIATVTERPPLPEVTVRQQSGGAVKPVPLQTPSESGDSRTPKRKLEVRDGCEPLFSPVVSPSMAHHTGRCIAAIEARRQFT